MSEELKEYSISAFYNGQSRTMKAEVIYLSAQIMRIKVYGKHSHIVLQNNYPMARLGKKAIQWKLIEGNPGDAKVLQDIMNELERNIKEDYRL